MTNPLPVALSDCYLCFENRMYPFQGTLAPGQSVLIQQEDLDLRWRLTRRGFAENPENVTPWDQGSLDVSRILEIMMFHAAADGQRYTKLGTIFVTVIVLAIALKGGSVFDLVIGAWSGLAASLGPLLVVRSLGGKPHPVTAIAMMATGFLAALAWGDYDVRYSVGLNEALPGMLAGFAIFWIGSAVTRKSPSA